MRLAVGWFRERQTGPQSHSRTTWYRDRRSESVFRIDAESVADHTKRRDETHLSAGHTGRERVFRDGNLFVDEVIGKVVGSAAGDSRPYGSIRRAHAELANTG